ncbi:PREDICTED: WD repeat-containing protein on Y chromosome-like [Acropora digitifera]|uniref:WD repeat-containing protein on Y chromosome-like n=1 Tax=Acropora digitifera TaxID=70779 RepID=UPI00077ACAE1|nr:PREDICTED: WD repeat-containing protein on Y chromosome-like [Acropora digitifera]
MPSGKPHRKVRPATASGALESHEFVDLLDESRPFTAPGKNLLGLDPTYVTSRHHVPGVPITSKFRGRQVFGGIPENDLKGTQGRRATLAGLEDVELHEKPKRPTTAVGVTKQVKLEDRITLDHLNKMRQAFEDADADGNGTLDLDEFKVVIKNLFHFKFKNDDQVIALFMKIDSSSDGEINWDEFCTFMQLEYAEKEDSYLRSKEETSIARIFTNTVQSNTKQQLRLQDGLVSFWSQNMEFKRMKQAAHLESTTKKTKWITDFVLMPQFTKFIISTGDREIQFFVVNLNLGKSIINYLKHIFAEIMSRCWQDCPTGPDECIILYGDSKGHVYIFIINSVGETLRNWKKMPKVEGIASVNIDSVVSLESSRFTCFCWIVHEDWVSQLKYYHSLRAVISCSNHPDTALVIGQTMGSTHIESQLQPTGASKKAQNSTIRDLQPRPRLDADQTVFRVYKGVKTFDFCKEKNVIVTGGMDRLVRLWNPYVPSKPTGLLRGHIAPIFHLFICAEDDRIFSVSTDKTVKVWDLHDHTCLVTVRPKAHKIRGDLAAIHYNSSSRGLAVATSEQIALLQLKNKSSSKDMITTHREPVMCVKYNSSFKHIITASENSVIKVWDLETGRSVFEFSHAHGDNAVTCMSFDSTERRLITGGRDGRLRIWNYNNGHCLRTLEKTMKKDSATLLSSGPLGLIHFWNIYTGGTLYAAFPPSNKGITTMSSVARDTRLITADSAGFISVWDVEDYCLTEKTSAPPERLFFWRAHVQSITSIEPLEHMKSEILLTSSMDCTVRLWTLEGHFVGTLGQPKIWDITNPVSYQYPMAPYDVLVDPQTLPTLPKGQTDPKPTAQETKHTDQSNEVDLQHVSNFSGFLGKETLVINASDIAAELKKKPWKEGCGKRLRHERLKRTPKDVGGPNAYQTLTCFDLEDTPKLPNPPSSASIDDPFDITI